LPAINADASIHGILLQLPLPKGLDEDEALTAIAPAKDVDGLHPMSLGNLLAGKPTGGAVHAGGLSRDPRPLRDRHRRRGRPLWSAARAWSASRSPSFSSAGTPR
jgi:hypothetical protein